MDLKENLLHGSESSIAEPVQTIREGLPRPRSGEFRALFEGNTPWHWGIVCSPVGVHRATIWAEVNAALKADGEGESKTNASTAATAAENKERSSNENSNTHSCNNNKNNSNQHYKSNAAFTLNRNNNTEHSLNIYTNTHTCVYNN